MSRYRDQVTAALEALAIRGPTRYAWLGQASRPLPGSLDATLDDAGRRSYLLATVREELYASFFCHGEPVGARAGRREPAADPWLVAAMSRANSGRGGWEPGWTVERVEDGEVVVAGSRLRTRIPIGDCSASEDAIRPGAAVSVRMPKEIPAWSPGFFSVVSEAPADLRSAESVIRVYWNITRAGAPALVAALTSRLNTARTPFRLKVADHPARLDRCDAAVLYLSGPSFLALRDSLCGVASELAAHLPARVPAFTLEIAPGVAVAEADDSGESFGARRCALVAEAAVRAHEQQVSGVAARVEAVAARFAEEGVQIDAPYLEPSLVGRHVL